MLKPKKAVARKTPAKRRMQAKKTDDPQVRRRKRRRILLGILVFLVLGRLALPYVVLYYSNKMLANMDGYYGHIEDIDIALYRGAYQIDDLYLKKVEKKDTIDFIDIKHIDLSLEWRAIFNGKIVGKVAMDSATIIFTREKNDIGDIAKDTSDFRNVMNSFMPIRMNKLEIVNSYIRYRDPFTSPQLDMKLTDLHVVALNLANAYDSSRALPAAIRLTANVYSGKLNLNMRLDPYADQPKFDMDSRLENTNLVLLNNFLRAYANVDVNKGTFGLYAEAAAKNGQFEGYVKPIIKDLDVVEWTKEEGNWMQVAYESIIGAAAWILKNKREDQLATKLYIWGDMKDPELGVGHAILMVLQNAFISALKPAIDQEINLSSVGSKEEEETMFDKLHPGKEDNKKDKKKSRKKKRKENRAEKPEENPKQNQEEKPEENQKEIPTQNLDANQKEVKEDNPTPTKKKSWKEKRTKKKEVKKSTWKEKRKEKREKKTE